LQKLIPLLSFESNPGRVNNHFNHTNTQEWNEPHSPPFNSGIYYWISYNQRTMSRRVPLPLAIAVHKPLIQVRQFLSPLNRAG
jgi:hypothetical protein